MIFEPKKPKAEIWGRRAGFLLATGVFFSLINLVSYLVIKSWGRGFLISGASVVLILVVWIINRKHKKWVW